METRLTFPGLSLPARLDAPPREVLDGVIASSHEVMLAHPFGRTHFYRHGWQSWSPTGWVDLGSPPVPIQPPERRQQADDPAYALSPVHSGSGLGAVEDADGRVLLLGALGIGARVEADAGLMRGFYEDGTGEWFAAFGGEQTVFARYADLLGERLGRRGEGTPPRVWCSWYSFYQEISEPALMEVLRDLRGFPFDVFQIDDGWQVDAGDWDANPRFPSGMEAMARRIEQAAFTPGLWLAPLLVRPSSRLYREHSDWLIRDAEGRPVPAGFNWGDFTYALDATHPDVARWLTDLIRAVCGWGYRYLKLDFLYSGALPGMRRQHIPREHAYRRALAAIRGAAPQAYILACGAPILASLGIVDGLRVGPDCAPYWDNEVRARYLHDRSGPAALNALRTSVHRLWLQPLAHVDPDAVYFRTRYNLLTPQQREYLRALALVTGFKGTSDPPAWLDPEEKEALHAFLTARPQVHRLGRYRFELDGRVVDFSSVTRE